MKTNPPMSPILNVNKFLIGTVQHFMVFINKTTYKVIYCDNKQYITLNKIVNIVV